MKKYSLLIFSIFLTCLVNAQNNKQKSSSAPVTQNAQPSMIQPGGGGGGVVAISGLSNVNSGQKYSYNFPYANSTWSVSGGVINSSTGTSATITWDNVTTATSGYVAAESGTTEGYLAVTINPVPLVGGSITPSQQTPNYGSSAAALSYSGTSGGNGTAISYQWQESFDNSTWSNLSGATGTTYNPGTINETAFFRVVLTQGTTVVYSSAASVSSTAGSAAPTLAGSSDNDNTSNVNLSNTVGTTKGSAGVNAMGGATYSIPIDVLPGTNGVQPGVGLVYNSEGGVGIAGWGWQLSAFSMITRAGKNTYYNGYTAPVAYSDSDAFVLDGQRLFPTSGSNGADGTVYGQESENFSQIISHGGTFTSGPNYFTVTTKDGSVMEYGLAPNAKLFTNDNQSVMLWLLDKVTDKNGNYYTLSYDIDETKRAYVLMEIDYTGNSNTGIAPYNKILFTYSNRNNYQNTNTYQSGYSLASPYLLNTVSIVNSSGTTVKTYSCTYNTNKGEYFLRYITESGASGAKMNPIRFSYGSDTTAVSEYVAPPYNSLNTNATLYAGNFSGDGTDEVLDAPYAVDNSGVYHYGGYTVLNNFVAYGNSAGLSIDYSANFNGNNNNVSSGSYSGYSVLTNDYDGDGKADALYANYTQSGSTVTLNKVQINCTKTAGSPFIFNYYDSLVYTALPVVSGTTYKIMDTGSFIIPGDFNGDGYQDYILILASSGTNYKAFFNSPKLGIVNQEIYNFGVGAGAGGAYYANTIASIKNNNVTPVDFDGDGKTDLLIQTPSMSYILTVNPGGSSGYNYAASILATTTAIVAGNRVYPGDFNGDGKTDLLVRTVASTYGTWVLFYSTGKGFNSYSYVPSYGIVLDDQGYSSSHLLMVADVNGDGRTDIVHSLDVSQGANPVSYQDISYSLGEPLPGTNSSTAFLEEINTVSSSTNLIGNKFPIYGDFNGDGKTDMVTLQNTNAVFIFPKPFKEDHLMAKAVNGLGAETDFSYGLLNEGGIGGSSFYSRSLQYYVDNSSTAAGKGPNGNPYNVIVAPLYAVRFIKSPDGIGGQNILQYTYMDAATHPVKGFLGFKQVTTTNESTGIQSVTVSNINSQFFVPHTVAQYTIGAMGDTVQKTSITDTLLAENANASDKRYVYHLIQTLGVDNLKGFAVQSANTYDSYGNITNNSAVKGYLTGSAVTAIESTTTTTAFGTYATPVPAYPTAVTVSNTRAGQSAVSKQTTSTYDTKGNALTVTDFAGTALATTLTNTYNGFGEITQTTMSAPSVVTPTVTNTYDNTGRFITQKQTSGSGITKTEKYTYNPVWGQLATYTSTDGLVTTKTYDNNFGILTGVQTPDGNTITQTYGWETTGNARYSITGQRVADGGMYSKEYYDILGRTIETQTGGFGGNLLTSTTTYDSRGLVTSQSPAQYSGEAINAVTATYDNYLRVTGSSNGITSATIAYTKNGSGQFTTTTTNTGASQSSSKTDDAAGKTVKATDNGGTLTYTYNSWGKQSAVQLGSVVMVSGVYDAYGRQTSTTDKNMGTISYLYDALGRVTQQTDPVGHVSTAVYDAFGRLTSHKGPEGTTTYTYYNNSSNGYCNDNVTSITGFSGDVTTNTYDNLDRLTTQTVTTGGNTFTKTMAYDSYNNLIATTYPSSVVIKDSYDKNGNLTQTSMTNGAYTKVLFTGTAKNSKGIYTGYSYGNSKTSTVTFNLNQGVPTRYYTAGIQDLNYTFDANTNNLLTRKDAIKSLTETFTYDNLNRLKTASVGSTQQFSINYDSNGGISMGNIASKSDIGNYTYDNNKVNAVDYVTSTAGGTTAPGVISQNQQTIAYTAFLKADSITQNGYQLTYTYGENQERIESILKQNGTLVETKFYLGAFERQIKGDTTRDIIYVSAGNGLCAVIVKQGTAVTPYFAYTDHLGSILTVTDTLGNIVAQQNFDAWGRNRNAANWTYTGVTAMPTWLYRGFEQHEMLTAFALINMNGRIYDPALARMISPDINITYPWSTQGYDRYGFALNNPLMYFDPTGNSIWSWFGGIGKGIGKVAKDVYESQAFRIVMVSALLAGSAFIGGEALAGVVIPSILGGTVSLGSVAIGVGLGAINSMLTQGFAGKHMWNLNSMFEGTLSGAITGALSSSVITNYFNGATGISGLEKASSGIIRGIGYALKDVPTAMLSALVTTSIKESDAKGVTWSSFGEALALNEGEAVGDKIIGNIINNVAPSGSKIAQNTKENTPSWAKWNPIGTGAGKMLNGLIPALSSSYLSQVFNNYISRDPGLDGYIGTFIKIGASTSLSLSTGKNTDGSTANQHQGVWLLPFIGTVPR